MDSKFGFRVGDRVVYAEYGGEFDAHIYGESGTVCRLDGYGNSRVGVEFDNYHESFHTCNGACKEGHGLYILCKELTHEVELPEFDVAEIPEILAFLS